MLCCCIVCWQKVSLLKVPLVQDLESDGTATFHFAKGIYEVHDLPKDFEDYFGPPPHMTFLSERMVEDPRVVSRENSYSKSPEQICRESTQFVSKQTFRASLVRSLAFLNKVIDEEGPFEGVIGYSEGAIMASSLLYERMQRHVENFKCAVFFCGMPPFYPDGSKVMLSDVYGEIFQIPTCHILGTDDPLIGRCLALYNLCSPSSRVLLETGANHMISWDENNLREVPRAVRRALSLVWARLAVFWNLHTWWCWTYFTSGLFGCSEGRIADHLELHCRMECNSKYLPIYSLDTQLSLR